MEVLDMLCGSHTPAMSPQEAAMLPAAAPGHFTMPLNPAHFVAVETPQKPKRKGSAAGRAILYTGGVNLPGVQSMRRGK